MSLNGKNMSHLTILTQTTPSEVKIEPKKPEEKHVFEHILNHFLKFEPLPPFISGLNSKFYHGNLFSNSKFTQPTFRSKILSLSKVTEEKL